MAQVAQEAATAGWSAAGVVVGLQDTKIVRVRYGPPGPNLVTGSGLIRAPQPMRRASGDPRLYGGCPLLALQPQQRSPARTVPKLTLPRIGPACEMLPLDCCWQALQLRQGGMIPIIELALRWSRFAFLHQESVPEYSRSRLRFHVGIVGFDFGHKSHFDRVAPTF